MFQIFQLAERKHRLVSELMAECSEYEFAHWIAYYELEQESTESD